MRRILSGPIHQFNQPSRRDPEERLRDRLSIAHSAIGITAGLGALAGAAVLARKGSKAIGRLEQHGQNVLAGLKDTAKSTIEAKVHPAVDQIKHAAANAQKAAENTANATVAYADIGKLYRGAKGGLYNLLHPIRTMREVKNAYRAGRHGAPMVKAQRPAWAMAARAKVLEFSNASVAQDRYRKGIKEADSDRALKSYRKAALAGGLAGLALRKPGLSRLRAAGLGAAAGIGAQSLVRAGTSMTKDSFGDRSTTGKKIDALAPAVLATGALVAGRKKVQAARRLAAMKASGAVRQTASRAVAAAPRTAWEVLKGSLFRTRAPLIQFAATSRLGAIVRAVRKPQVKGKLIAGAALAGGIATADAITGAVFPEKGKTSAEAARTGLLKGTLYGTALAGSEPLISAGLRRVLKTVRAAKRPVVLSARARLLLFGGHSQLRDKGNRFVDPIDVASGTAEAWHYDDRGVPKQVDRPVLHGQVLKAAWNKGRQVQQHVQRGTNLVTDAVQAARGIPKTDSRGRPVKREWEKAWVRNAVGSALLAGGVLGHAAIMRRNPAYRARVVGLVKAGKQQVNKVVPDFFPGHLSSRAREIRFDLTAPNWDVRDERGRSARVFAPGARPRQRREKDWHERVDNIRLLGLLGAGAGAAAGLGAGALLWRKAGVKRAPFKRTPKLVIPFNPKAA